MIEEEIISNLNLELTDMTIGSSFAYGFKIYKLPDVSTEKSEVFLMECDTMGQPINDDTSVVYSTKGYFHVPNQTLKDPNKEELYALIARKLNLKLNTPLS